MSGVPADRILFITQQYVPESIGSGPYMTEMAEYLAARGAEIAVLTSRPYYPDGVVPDGWRRGERDIERIGGVTVMRLKPWLSRQRGFAGRVIGEYAFFLRGFRAFAARRVRRSPIVVSLCPSILAVVLGALAKTRGGRHLVVVHDIQSGLAEGLSMVRTPWILYAMKRLERFAFNRADHILVLSDEMGDRLRAQGVTTPIETLPIWVDTGFIQPRPVVDTTVPTILYSGNLGRKQALDQIVEMAALLKAHGTAARIVLRGNGSEAQRLAAAVDARGLDNVTFAPLVPRERLAEGLAEGDVHLVPQDDRTADFAVPSKVFGIMAAGRAFVAAAPPGSQLWRLRDRSHAFLCVPSGDVAALTGAVERLVADRALRDRLGGNGRAFAIAEHDRAPVLGRFADCLLPTVDGGAPVNEHLLIFEPDPRGHAREWLEHLIERIVTDPRPIRATLAIPEELAVGLRGCESYRIAVRPLTRGETHYCNHPRLAVSGFARWWTTRRHVKAAGATRAVFLGLDHLTLPLGLGLSVAGRPTSGILFRPCTHYGALGCGGGRRTLKERVRDLRKDALTALTANNASVDTIFSLDPYFPEFAAARYRNGHKVVPIWDPAFPAPLPDSDDRIVADDLPDDRTTLILFGEITERKGIFALLSAVSRLPDDVAARVAVVVAGRIDPAIRAPVCAAAAAARETAPALWLRLIDRRLASGEIAALVERSNVVLLPYQRFVGSSGVLLWAARFNRPVICQDYGLIGILTRNFGLGITVDTSDPDALATAIAQAAGAGGSLPCDPAGMRAFVAPRRPELFASTLLGADG